MRQGGCLCGAVRYRVEGEPLSSGICHCQTCRRTASAPTLPFVVFAVEAFAITQGEPAEFHSSSSVTRGFCGRCGSPLTYRHAGHPATVDIMTCSLDDPEALPPAFHVWVGDKLAWDTIPDDLPAYATTQAASAP